MTKKLVGLFCLILLLGTSNLLQTTYSEDEREVTRSTPRSQRYTRLQANPTNSVVEDTMPWTRTYGGIEDDTANSIIQTPTGDYLFAGFTGSWPNDVAWLVKIDTYGNVQWTQTYNLSVANAVIPTADGGYALAGTKGGYLGSASDAWLVKTDAHGNAQWTRTYHWKDRNYARSVLQTHDGGFIVGGFYSDILNQSDAWLAKTDVSGTMEWMQTYGGLSNDQLYAVIQTTTEGFAFVGETWSYGEGLNDCWLVKTNTRGEMEWNRTYGDSGSDRGYAMTQMGDGSFILTGSTSSYGAGSGDAWLVKTDVDGTMEWMQTYGGSYPDTAYSGILTANGGYALAGVTKSFGASTADFDFWLVKLDASGAVEWNQAYGGSRDEETNSIIQTTEGFVLAGRTRSYGAGMWDAWLVKTDVGGIAPDIFTPQRNWFVIGLLGSLTFVTIVVVVLYVRRYWGSRKWP